MNHPVTIEVRHTFRGTFATLVRLNRWAPLFPLGMALGFIALTLVMPPSVPGPDAFWQTVYREWAAFLALLLIYYLWQASRTVKHEKRRGPGVFHIDELGVLSRLPGEDDTFREWSQFRRVVVNRHDVLLFFGYGVVHALPRAQVSDDELRSIVGMAEAASVKVWGARAT